MVRGLETGKGAREREGEREVVQVTERMPSENERRMLGVKGCKQGVGRRERRFQGGQISHKGIM